MPFAEVFFYYLFTDITVEVFVNSKQFPERAYWWNEQKCCNIGTPVCLIPIERWILIARSCIAIVLHIAHRLLRSWGKQINDQMESRRRTFLQLPTSTWHKYSKMRREIHIWRNSQLYHYRLKNTKLRLSCKVLWHHNSIILTKCANSPSIKL